MINNNEINLFLLKWIIGEIYIKTCRNWTLPDSDKEIEEIKVIYREF